MKITVCLLFVSVFFLAGCNKPDPRIAQLETRVTALESNLAANGATDVTNYDLLANYVDALHTLVTNLAPEQFSTSSPNTPSPSPGATVEQGDASPIFFPASGKVTDTSSVWWKWSFQFSIGNPSTSPMRLDVKVKFFDAQGYVVDKKTEYHLLVPALSTNHFSDYDLITLPGAQNVKTIRVEPD